MPETCQLCGSPLQIKTRLTGDKSGLRYLVCSKYPSCTFRKSYAEQGKEYKWTLENGFFSFLPKKD
jgi:ssDNA-binding Zn-finger/Zn-ribbon topoisomerase 1